jgi:predicted P-loop ATPase
VGELGGSIRRSDREAWKFFISTETVTVRRSYGHFDMKKPAITSFIGTLNDTGGYLDDPSGYRRYLPVTISHIGWDYAKDVKDGGVDPNQVWAQVKALYDGGERGRLGAEDHRLVEAIATTVEVTNPLEDALVRWCEFDPKQPGWFIPTLELLMEMRRLGFGGRSSDTEFARQLTERMGKLGGVRRRVPVDGVKTRGFLYVRWRAGISPAHQANVGNTGGSGWSGQEG